jgi:hypothetical protein
MQIKYPRINFCWNGKDHEIALEMVRNYIRFAVYVSPLAIWKLIDIIKELIR